MLLSKHWLRRQTVFVQISIDRREIQTRFWLSSYLRKWTHWPRNYFRNTMCQHSNICWIKIYGAITVFRNWSRLSPSVNHSTFVSHQISVWRKERARLVLFSKWIMRERPAAVHCHRIRLITLLGQTLLAVVEMLTGWCKSNVDGALVCFLGAQAGGRGWAGGGEGYCLPFRYSPGTSADWWRGR